jgi:hypothetical protein
MSIEARLNKLESSSSASGDPTLARARIAAHRKLYCAKTCPEGLACGQEPCAACPMRQYANPQRAFASATPSRFFGPHYIVSKPDLSFERAVRWVDTDPSHHRIKRRDA